MFTHSDFVALVRQLVTRHKAIRHREVDGQRRFVRAAISFDLVQAQVDLQELDNMLRNQLAPTGPYVCLLSYEAQYADNGSDQHTKTCHGGLLVLDRPTPQDADSLDAVYSATEALGEQLQATLLRDFSTTAARREGRRFSANDLDSDRVARIGDGLAGTRFVFSFTVAANAALTHDENLYDPE